MAPCGQQGEEEDLIHQRRAMSLMHLTGCDGESGDREFYPANFLLMLMVSHPASQQPAPPTGRGIGASSVGSRDRFPDDGAFALLCQRVNSTGSH